MKIKLKLKQAALLLSISMLAAGPAFGEKPDSPGNSEKQKSSHQYGKDSKSYFSDDRLQRVRNYYSESKASGKCPPGLAKKGNGCRPPGQAKKWRLGEPLPRDVVYYDLPRPLLHELGRTPEGQKIVRVGTDLLLISIGTGMIIDAVQDLDDIF
jgi:Ni/Co efflux regulator RcnB